MRDKTIELHEARVDLTMLQYDIKYGSNYLNFKMLSTDWLSTHFYAYNAYNDDVNNLEHVNQKFFQSN